MKVTLPDIRLDKPCAYHGMGVASENVPEVINMKSQGVKFYYCDKCLWYVTEFITTVRMY